MRHPPERQPACGRWYTTAGWLAATAAYSHLHVAATRHAGTSARDCGHAAPYPVPWELVLLLALLVLLAEILWATRRGGTRRRGLLKDAAHGLLVALPACAFVLAYAAGWWGACDIPAVYVAALSSVGAVLSAAMFGIYLDVRGASGEGRFRDVPLLISVLAAAAFAYYMLPVADSWGSRGADVARQYFAAIAMVAMSAAAAVFSAEYGKGREQRLTLGVALSAALIFVGVLAYLLPLGADGRRVEGGGDSYLYAVQTMWAGAAVVWAMLAARIAMGAREKKWRPKHHLLWLIPAILLAALDPLHQDYFGLWGCLTSMAKYPDQPSPIVALCGDGDPDEVPLTRWALVTIFLGVWKGMVAAVAAMLGAAVASRMRAKHTV